MAKYRKKPVVIEAMRIETDTTPRDGALDLNTESQAHIAGWLMGNGFHGFKVHGERAPFGIAIETLEGVMVASPGDYIIRGIQGEFYPCKPGIFDATYEPVQSWSTHVQLDQRAARLRAGRYFLVLLAGALPFAGIAVAVSRQKAAQRHRTGWGIVRCATCPKRDIY